MASSENGRRLLALWFPRLSTDRLHRRWKANERSGPRSDTANAPLVVAGKAGNALRLAAVDRKATALGLVSGMPLADAQAMLPDLQVMAANEPADLTLLNSIADWCSRYTPFVALEPPRALVLDVTGAAHLFGGEKSLLDDIRVRLSRQGFAVRCTLAGSAMATLGLARFCDGAIVPPGEDARVIAPLPIDVLRLDAETLHAFRRAGLKTIGQVAGRERSELTARFGAAMVSALDDALGKSEKPISPGLPLPDYSAEHRFAEPIMTEAAVLETLCVLVGTLAGTLVKRAEGARRWEAVFFRADGAVRRIAVETSHATRDARIMERLFREKLDALTDPLDPGFGYDLIRLEAGRVERAKDDAITFDSQAGEKELRFLVDRLAARFGSRRILAFQPNDTHIPESAFAVVPAQYAEPSQRRWENIRRPKEAPRCPLRLFAKPELVNVTAEFPEGPPIQFRWRRVLYRVVRAEGPERIAMEWWRHQRPQPTRDYFRIEDANGHRFWLYRLGLYGREMAEVSWYLHGIFA